MSTVRELGAGEAKPDMSRWVILHRHPGNRQVTATTIYAETMLAALEHCGVPAGSIYGACMWEHAENIGAHLTQTLLNIAIHESEKL
jgi:hypothetical protein